MMGKTAPEMRKMQFIKGNAEDEERLAKINPKWIGKYHVVDKINGGNTNGFIDINGGITIADKACVYARFLCVQAGVKFVLGEPQGKLETLITEANGSQRKVIGIKTYDGQSHFGDLIIVACETFQFINPIFSDMLISPVAGGWTASIIPEAHRAVETTAGTVMFIDIPQDRKDLWEKFHPDNYPVWSYRRGEGDE